MGFGRILYHLILNNGKVNCIVDGYDMYVEEESYSKYYPTLTRQNNKLNEAMIVQGLADHDFIYDFLKVKELVKNVNIIDSDRFLDIINMPVSRYLEKIATVRNFKLLEKI